MIPHDFTLLVLLNTSYVELLLAEFCHLESSFIVSVQEISCNFVFLFFVFSIIVLIISKNSLYILEMSVLLKYSLQLLFKS